MRPITIVTVLPALALLVLAAFCISDDSDAASGGKCGDDVTWSYDSGRLTISGEGPMDDFRGNSPWNDVTLYIREVAIGNGVTYIGYGAFSDCSNMVTASIPYTVRHIGDKAFLRCANLTEIYLPYGLWHIGDSAFLDCTRLETVFLPGTLLSIGNHAFFGCSELVRTNTPGDEFVLPDSLNVIGTGAFAMCLSLRSVTAGSSLVEMGASAFYGCDNLKNVVNRSTLEITKGRQDNGCIALYADTLSGQVIEKNNGTLGFRYNDLSNAAFVISVNNDRERLELTSVQTPIGAAPVVGFMPGIITESNNFDDIIFGDDIGYIPGGWVKMVQFRNYTFGRSVWYIDESDLSAIFIGTLTVSENNEHYMSYENCLYSKDGTTLIRGSVNNIGEGLYVKDGTKRMTSYAIGHDSIETISLPSSMDTEFTLNMIWCTITISDDNAKLLARDRYVISSSYSVDLPERVQALVDDSPVLYLNIGSITNLVDPVPTVLNVDSSPTMMYSILMAIDEGGSYKRLDAALDAETFTISTQVDGTRYIVFTLDTDPFFKNPLALSGAIVGAGLLIAAVVEIRRRMKA